MTKPKDQRPELPSIRSILSGDALARWELWKKLNSYEKARYYYKAGSEPSLEDRMSVVDYVEAAPEEM